MAPCSLWTELKFSSLPTCTGASGTPSIFHSSVFPVVQWSLTGVSHHLLVNAHRTPCCPLNQVLFIIYLFSVLGKVLPSVTTNYLCSSLFHTPCCQIPYSSNIQCQWKQRGQNRLKRHFFLFFFKVFIEFVTIFFCFMFWFFGHRACGILAPWPGIEPASPALECEVLTTGPPGKSLRDISEMEQMEVSGRMGTGQGQERRRHLQWPQDSGSND